MKKLLVLFIMFTALSISGCGSKAKLEDFCGQTPLTSYTEKFQTEYYLVFKNPKGPGVVDVNVSRNNYLVYKDGTMPIDCPDK